MPGSALSYHLLKVAAVKEEVAGFKTFYFEAGHNVSWKAGQYLTIVKQFAGEELRRSYSIVSSPILNENLAIGVKRMENGLFSRWLIDSIHEGDEVKTIGAGGFFTLPDDILNYRQIFFFAAGSGITPVYSLIKTVLRGYPLMKVVLVYSNASREKTIFLQALQQLAADFRDQFSLELLYSNNPELRKARLNRDLLLQLVNTYMISSYDHTLFYTCGPESYMRLCTYVLLEQGASQDRVRRENFVTHKLSIPVEPPDKGRHQANVVVKGKKYTIIVDFPDSILTAAKKQRINLPYSCEAGQCGSCVALCISGKIWHSVNEILTENELNKGLVLTCVGHPVGGDVFLEIK